MNSPNFWERKKVKTIRAAVKFDVRGKRGRRMAVRQVEISGGWKIERHPFYWGI